MTEDNKDGKRMSAEARETHIERVRARKTLLERIKRDFPIWEGKILAMDDETKQEVPVEVREHINSLNEPIFPYEEAVKYLVEKVRERMKEKNDDEKETVRDIRQQDNTLSDDNFSSRRSSIEWMDKIMQDLEDSQRGMTPEELVISEGGV